MKAIRCNTLTGYKDLSLEDRSPPNPAANEILIDVKYAALNFFDTLITEGKYQEKPTLPFTPGGEVAGRVAQTQGKNSTFAEGDRVMAYIGWGGLQEQIAVPEKDVIKIPANMSDEAAASLMITYGTAMHGLVERAQITAGETIVILGAAGGAGLAALEVAKASEAKVIAVCASDDKCQLTLNHGADAALNCQEIDIKQELKQHTNGNGVDVVYDCVGGALSEPALRSLKWRGRYLVVGFAAGEIPAIPLNLILLKGARVDGVFLGRFIKEQADEFNRLTRQLLTWAETGKINPHIDKIYPLAETVAALDHLASRTSKGKILIDVAASAPK